MNYLVTHWILLTIVKTIMINILGRNYDWTMFWVLVGTCVITLPLLSKLLNQHRFDWMMGRK